MQVAGEERDASQPSTNRVADRDLLWVESVSERLLGHSAPRAWEKAFFRPEPAEQPEYPGQRPEVPTPSGQRWAVPDAAPRPPAAPRPEARVEAAPVQTTRFRGEEAPRTSASVAPGIPEPVQPVYAAPPVPTYFSEGDADWRYELGPEFPEGSEDELPTEPDDEPDLVIDLTDPVHPQPPEPPSALGRIDDEMLRLALRSGDTVLANAVLLLLEERSRDRQHIATLETALRALIEQVDRIDGPDHELAVTARLLRRVVDR